MLLHDSYTGVLRVKHSPDPDHVRHQQLPVLNTYNTSPKQVPVTTAARMLKFNIYWPQSLPANYILDSINVYVDSYIWADGPIVDLVYDADTSHIGHKGTGQIVIREFKPLEQVLQVVQDGNAYPINLDQYGYNPSAIYVDGQWLASGKISPQIWGRGGRSEVIYQQNGVVFWIAGDQRDGIGQKVLWKLAQSLQTMSFMPHLLLNNEKATILQPNSLDPNNSPFSSEILSIASIDGTDSQYYVSLSDYIQGKLGSSKTTSHGH